MKKIALFIYFLPTVIVDSVQAAWFAADKLDPLRRVEYGFYVYLKKVEE